MSTYIISPDSTLSSLNAPVSSLILPLSLPSSLCVRLCVPVVATPRVCVNRDHHPLYISFMFTPSLLLFTSCNETLYMLDPT